MIEIIKTLLLDLNKTKLDEADIVLLTATLEMILDEVHLNLETICLIQLLLNQLDLLKEEVEKDFVLKQRIAEAKFKVLRLGLAQLNKIEEATPKRIINNMQITMPSRSGSPLRKVDVFEYEDGTIEEKELFNIHPKIKAQMDSPLLNDFAQSMMNKKK